VRWLVPALLAALVAGGLPAAAAAPTAGKCQPGPLAVRLTSMSPATIPQSGTLRLRGIVTNTSEGSWQDINVHAFVSTEPITTSAGLVKAAALPYDADVGDRLQTGHAFVAIGDLPPGKSTDFSLRIPRSELPIPDQRGVYWVGVHALGTNKLGRDTVADGRARTFAPLYRATTPRTDLTMVMPFRAQVRRDSTGALVEPRRWKRLLGEEGRLERILGEVESAGSTPVTLVVDPTVLDAADTLAGTPQDPIDGGLPSPRPSSTPGDEGGERTGTPSSDATADESGDDDDPAGARARAWLDRLTKVAATKAVLGTGYSDPDVAGLARRSPELLTSSFELARGTFEAYRVDAQAAVVPPGGYLPRSALRRIDSETRVLLTYRTDHPARTDWRSPAGQQILFGDAGAQSGGPGPSAPRTALAIRQRIVSDAALRAMSGSRAPMVVILPAGWDPGTDWRQAVRHHVRQDRQLRGDPGQRPRPAGAGRDPRPHQQPAAHDRHTQHDHAASEAAHDRAAQRGLVGHRGPRGHPGPDHEEGRRGRHPDLVLGAQQPGRHPDLGDHGRRHGAAGRDDHPALGQAWTEPRGAAP
jgi:hypothetical protein